MYGRLKLTSLQLNLWFEWKSNPNSTAYNIPLIFKLEGPLSISSLETAFQAVTNRNDALRTYIEEVNGHPFQVILSELNLPKLETCDITNLIKNEQDYRLKEFIDQTVNHVFDIYNPPLFRASLIKTAADIHYMIINAHHIIADGFSGYLLLKEISTYYNDHLKNITTTLPPIKITIKDILNIESEYLNSEQYQIDVEFWKNALKGATLYTNLPSTAIKNDENKNDLFFSISSELTKSIKNLAFQEKSSPFLVLLATFKILLYRYSGQEDITIGFPMNLRPKGAELFFGYFANLLFSRTIFNETLLFSNILSQITDESQKIQRHKRLSTMYLIKEVRSELEHTTCNITFNQTYFGSKDLNLSEIIAMAIPAVLKDVQNELSFYYGEDKGEITFKINYSNKRFSRQFIKNMAAHFLTLLEAIIKNPNQIISEINLITAAERQKILIDWNSTQVTYPNKLLHELFEEQVLRTPNHIAVSFEDKSLSYEELNRKANQLAHYLREQYLANTGEPLLADTLIAICAERSLEMVIGILAIMKAAGAYVPIDPGYPIQRIEYLLQDSQAKLLLTQKKLISSLEAISVDMKLPPVFIQMDGDWDEIQKKSSHNLEAFAQSNHLAYVIYTSGSTGQPKGVMIPHLGVVNRILWMQDTFQLNENETVLQKTPFSFDVSVWEFFLPLITGARLVMSKPGGHRDSAYIKNIICSERITTLHFVPSILRLFLHEDDITKFCKSLRYVVCSGEELAQDIESNFFKIFKDQNISLYNLYGPTEASIDVTSWRCEKDNKRSFVPIGYPIANTQTYILNQLLQPQPVAIPGILFLGGIGLARGYLNRQELTKEKFIPNPFIPEKNARIYNTGDLACHDENGSIQYLGRIDDQVKLHGFRIELGEIEEQLRHFPKIQQCVVLVKSDKEDKHLVAFIVVKENVNLILDELREFLQARLPGYMIPNYFVLMDEIPLSPNGKIDKKTLLKHELNILKTQTDYTPPATGKEKILTDIWATILHQEASNISINDNFFELGGDSILGLQVMAKARQAKLQLSVQQLFAHPTIAGLASVASYISIATTEQGPVTGPAALTPIQRWFFDSITPNYAHFNQAVLYQVEGEFNAALFKTAFLKLIEHHDSLRFRYKRQEDFWQQFYADIDNKNNLFFYEEQDLSHLDENQQDQAIGEHNAYCQTQFNLTTGPLIFICHYFLGHGSHRILLVFHHLIIDSVSWRILLEDLENLHEQLMHGADENNLQLPAKTSSFKAWSTELESYAQTDLIKAQQNYWLAQTQLLMKNIAGFDQSIPVDYPHHLEDFTTCNTIKNFRNITLELSVEDTQALLQKVPLVYNTQINDILLTALILAFNKIIQIPSLLIHLEGHGREPFTNSIDISRTIGWFTSLFPVCLDLENTPITHLGKILQIIKEQLRKIPNGGIGYGMLKYLCHDKLIKQALSDQPKPAIVFNYLGQFNLAESPDALFKIAKISVENLQSPDMVGEHLLEINAWISKSSLKCTWAFSREFYNDTTVQTLAQNYMNSLHDIITHCKQQEHGAYTPSDFPLISLNLDELDTVFKENLGEWEPKLDINNLYPLSPLQQGLLFHQAFNASSNIYLIQFQLFLTGKLDIANLKIAFQYLLDQFDVLRTGFIKEKLTQPLQFVVKKVAENLQLLDIRHLDTQAQETYVTEFLDTDRKNGFDLKKPPLVRCTVIQTSNTDYQFIWTNDHIILDGWSLAILLKTLFTYYNRLNNKQHVTLGHSTPYQNFIAWLKEQDPIAAENYWRNLLKGFTTSTQLDISKDSKNLNAAHDQTTFYCSQILTERIQEFSRKHHITISTLLSGVFAKLLHTYSGETDVVYGSTVSGRSSDLSNIEEMVGLFINSLPIRSQMEPKESILDYLKNLQNQSIASQSYEYATLMQIQAWSDAPKGTPLFNHLIIFENYPMEGLSFQNISDLQLKDLKHYEHTHYELSLVAWITNVLTIRIDYDTSRYELAMIDNLKLHFISLLETFVEQPEAKITEISLLSSTEKQHILSELNATQVSYTEDKTLLELFENQVRHKPDDIAISFEDQHLTYLELNTKANQLAHYLRAQYLLHFGEVLSPNTLIAIATQRSLEMVVGILGILKSGAAYVPIDPDYYPVQRIEYMLQDCQAKFLLTQHNLMPSLHPIFSDMKSPPICIQLDSDWPNIAHESEFNLNANTQLENLAYVIYTSGSTGQPKGVMIPRSALSHYVCWGADYYRMNQLSASILHSSIAFDLTVTSLFIPLISGKTVVIIPSQNIIELAEALKKNPGPHLIKITPSHLKVLQQLFSSQELKYLAGTTFVLGGEALYSEDLAFLNNADNIRVVNEYGPTETTVGCCVFDAELQHLPALIPIGKPIVNTQLYVLDKYKQLVPENVIGELYIGGSGLSRGYLNRPELTQERFIPNPFQPNSLLYKTGDLVRLLSDGNLEFLGRNDDQVKIRGFRLELGEIEAQLQAYPQVHQCTVLVKSNKNEKNLIAFIVPKNTISDLNILDLRGFLKKSLPDYMIPDTFKLLDAMPLTPNGKVDRKALLLIEAQSLTEKYIAPQTELEQRVAEVWKTVLNKEKVGIHTNFFDAGGHSLLLLQLHSQLKAILNTDISIVELYQYPTISDFVNYLEKGEETESVLDKAKARRNKRRRRRTGER